MSLSVRRVASLGEGLIELRGRPFGSIHQGCGGDSLNTAVYLARLGKDQFEVSYVSVVGGDALSAGMLECWTAEGIRTELVLRDPSRLPGLYWIQTDDQGERSFHYWRGNSAWRHFLQHPDFNRVALALKGIELLYLTGVSLATLPAKDRERLLELLLELRRKPLWNKLGLLMKPMLSVVRLLFPVSAHGLRSAQSPVPLWSGATVSLQ